MQVDDRGIVAHDDPVLSRKMEAIGWGALFVWIGVALLAHVGWAVGLIGAGVITLGVQTWRKRAGVGVDRFAMILGILFVFVGVWNLFDVRVDLVPILFIVAGVWLLASTWRARDAAAGDHAARPRA
jgi:hypothetical protein